MISPPPLTPTGPQPRLHAWVDESMPAGSDGTGAYVMAAVVADVDCCPPIREELIALRLPGQNKLHWHDEGTSRRAKISAAIAGCDISAVVVVGIPIAAVKQERARVKCLERLLFELDGLHVEQVVLEARTPALNARDMKTVIRLRGREVISTRIRVEIGYPSSEPMLWTADAVAGAVSAERRGDGAWVAVLDEILTQIELPLR